MDPYYPRGVPPAPYSYPAASDETINNPAGSRRPSAQHFSSVGAPVQNNPASYGPPVSPPSPGLEYRGEFIKSDLTAQGPFHPSTPELVGQTISQQPTPPVHQEDAFAHLRPRPAQNGQTHPIYNAPSGFHPDRPPPAPAYPMPYQPQEMTYPPWAPWTSFQPVQQASYPQYGFDGFQGSSQHHFNINDPSRQTYPFTFTASHQPPTPPFQQLQTSNLTNPQVSNDYPFGGPLPGRSSPSQPRVDEATRRRQEEYARRGEAARLKRAERVRQRQAEQADQKFLQESQPGQAERHATSQQLHHKLGSKRKAHPTVDLLLQPTQAPALRPTLLHGSAQNQQSQQMQHPQSSLEQLLSLQNPRQLQYGHHDVAASGFGQQPLQGLQSLQGLMPSQYPGQHPFHPINSQAQHFQPTNLAPQYSQPAKQPFQPPMSANRPPQYQPVKEPSPEPVKINPEDLPQPITDVYNDYKWPIKLYEVHAAVYDFAQLFLEDIFVKHSLYSLTSNSKWHAHTTKGFLKEGSRLSFVVLHNAANPFEWGNPPESTTSVGVYGRHGHEADKEIHWKTFTPDIRNVLQEYMEKGYFSLKTTWQFDMPKASDRRFHRAYWHAAKMLPLGGLLNHPSEAEAAHDAVEEVDEKMSFTEEDLQSGWEGADANETKAEAAWNDIVKENEENEFVQGESEHVVTGCSEWDQFGK